MVDQVPLRLLCFNALVALVRLSEVELIFGDAEAPPVFPDRLILIPIPDVDPEDLAEKYDVVPCVVPEIDIPRPAVASVQTAADFFGDHSRLVGRHYDRVQRPPVEPRSPMPLGDLADSGTCDADQLEDAFFREAFFYDDSFVVVRSLGTHSTTTPLVRP